MPNNIFNLEDLTRDLAWQYANGYMTTDEYLSEWEKLTLINIKNSNAL